MAIAFLSVQELQGVHGDHLASLQLTGVGLVTDLAVLVPAPLTPGNTYHHLNSSSITYTAGHVLNQSHQCVAKR